MKVTPENAISKLALARLGISPFSRKDATPVTLHSPLVRDTLEENAASVTSQVVKQLIEQFGEGGNLHLQRLTVYGDWVDVTMDQLPQVVQNDYILPAFRQVTAMTDSSRITHMGISFYNPLRRSSSEGFMIFEIGMVQGLGDGVILPPEITGRGFESIQQKGQHPHASRLIVRRAA